MIRTIGSVPVKTRVPLAAWAFAGLITLFSTASSLLQVVTDPGQNVTLSASEQATTFASKTHRASVN